MSKALICRRIEDTAWQESRLHEPTRPGVRMLASQVLLLRIWSLVSGRAL